MVVETMSAFFALLTLVALAIALGGGGLLVASRFSEAAAARRARLASAAGAFPVVLAWCVAATCTLGSLFYSEVAHFVPCELCWYQRIAMYPLSVVLAVAALRRDAGVRRYVLPVVAIGAAISVYHYLIERFPQLEAGSCGPNVPCTVTQVWQFHFISIPFMALSGFAAIAVLVLLAEDNEAMRTMRR